MKFSEKELKVLNASQIGIEFELYSLMPKKDMVASLEKATGKKIKWINQYHSEFVPTDKVYKLEPDFSGGMKMCELITGPIKYAEFPSQMKIVLDWISANGWTDEKCAMQVNISFLKWELPYLNSISKINRLKFCLEIDEDFVLKNFEERRKSLYARTLKQLIPIHRWIYSENALMVNEENWILPNEKYYGVNFTKRLNEYLEFRYMGGRDYEKKYEKIMENSNYFILFMYKILTKPEFTDENIKQLGVTIKNNKKVSDSFSDLESFLLNWKNIQLLVDLKFNNEVIEAFWNIIREKLFDIIVNAKWTSGTINYDTDRNVFQLKDAKVVGAFNLRNIEFINCKLSGIFYNCEFWSCEVNDSHLHECKIWSDNTITKCKIMESDVEEESNVLKKCYIDNKLHSVKGTIIGGILRSGRTSAASIKKEVEIIDIKRMERMNDKDKK